MYCSKCGSYIEDDTSLFCKNCGASIENQQIPEKTKAAVPTPKKSELLIKLKQCQDFIEDIQNHIQRINKINDRINDLKKEEQQNNEIEYYMSYFVFIPFLLLFILPSITSTGIIDVIIINICLLICTIIIDILIEAKRRKNFNRKKVENANRISAEIQKSSNQKNKLLNDISDRMNSSEGKEVQKFIPKNYFYPNAVARFIYYIENGHADTMKEALKEYDQYLHRCKLEYEATRTSTASERTAYAAERSAHAMEQNAAAMHNISSQLSNINENLQTIEQETNNISFWETYNSLKNL